MNKFEGYSPAPWRMITPCDDADFIVINDSNGDMLFSCSPGTYRPMSQDYANMALAEASPELLRQRDLLLEELRLIRQGWKDLSNPKLIGNRSLTPWETERLKFAEESIVECEKGSDSNHEED